MSVLTRIKKLFRGYGRFEPTVGMSGIPPCTVRPFSGQDLSACRLLYELNEPGRFPPGYLDLFIESLESPTQLFLVVEFESQVAAVGGIYRAPESRQWCSLVFGMVHPNLHRKGLGTALLLARLSVLEPPTGVWWAGLASAGGSETFFKRFGFLHYGRYPSSADMREYDCYSAYLEEDWKSCARVLAERHVNLDRTELRVPIGPATSNDSMGRLHRR